MSAVLTTDDHMATMKPLADKAGARLFCIAESWQDHLRARVCIPGPPSYPACGNSRLLQPSHLAPLRTPYRIAGYWRVPRARAGGACGIHQWYNRPAKRCTLSPFPCIRCDPSVLRELGRTTAAPVLGLKLCKLSKACSKQHDPAGALHTHASLAAQVQALVTSWEWQSEDRILHCLPLHHVHGIINALYCAHAVGATVEFQPKFSPKAVWAALKVRHQKISMPYITSAMHAE